MIILTIVALIAVVAVCCWYLIYIPSVARRRGITDADKLAKFRAGLTKNFAQVAGGVAILATLAWTVGSGIITLRQTAVQSANQQFIDASKLSGDSNTQLSAAGNYAFAKLAGAYPEYCLTITSILTNQIAEYTAKLSPYQTVMGKLAPHVPGNINAAIRVLGSMPRCINPIQLTDDYLSGIKLIAGSQSLAGADLRNAWLLGSYLGHANFDAAQFDGAHMSDVDAVGGDSSFAKMQKSDRNWANDRYNYIVNFEHASLRKATFTNTSLSGASFAGASDLSGADFTNTNISRVDFTDAKNVEAIVLRNAPRALAACYNEGEEPINLSASQHAALRHPC